MLRYLILADGDFGPMTSKTANSVIRYRPDQIAAVLDRAQAGRTVNDVLGFGGDTPVVATVAEGLARGANAVLVGIAPQGGRLPDEWRVWLLEAVEHGCEVWSGLHTFIADDPAVGARARERGVKIHDLRRPRTMRPEDLCLPLNGLILLLFNVFDLLHKARELLELSPRLVGHFARNREVKRFDDVDELELLVFALFTALVTADCVTHLVLNGGDSFQPSVFDVFDSSFERGRGC